MKKEIRYSILVFKCYYDFQTGHMKTSMGSYFIKPTEHWREGDKDSLGSSLEHAIYRVPAAGSNFNKDTDLDIPEDKVKSRNCGIIGESTFTLVYL